MAISQTLYGGGYRAMVASAHVIIAGTGSINPMSNAGLHDIIGGSYQGSVTGDVYLEISGNIQTAGGNHLNPGCVTGDGASGDAKGAADVYVGGDAVLIYDNSNASAAPAIEGTYGCEMKGNVTLDVRSGRANEICGTQEFPDKSIIRGDLHIIAGAQKYENTDRTLRLNGNWGIYGAGNQFAEDPSEDGKTYTVGGDIVIDTYENVWGWDKDTTPGYDVPEIYGASLGNVGGSITINARGSHVENITGAEDSTIDGGVSINVTDVELKNSYYEDPDYDEGDILALRYSASGKACKVVVDGGDVNIVRLTNAKAVSDGSEIVVSGSPKIRTGILSTTNYSNAPMNAPAVTFDNCKASIPFLQSATDVNVINGSQLTLNGLWLAKNLAVENGSSLTTNDDVVELEGSATVNGSWEQLYNQADGRYHDVTVAGSLSVGQNGRFVNHGTTSVGEGVSSSGLMALLKPAIFKGSYKGDSAEMRLPIVVEGKNYNTGTIPLNIREVASGSTTVNTVDASDWQTLKKPAFGDNYILGKMGDGDKPDQSAFVLGNQDALEDGYYLKRTNDVAGTDDNYMWQVAKQASVTFDDNGAGVEGYPITVGPKDLGEGETTTFNAPSQNPIREGYTFAGWNMQQNGEGEEFEGGVTKVSKPTTVYAQWVWNAKSITVTFDDNGAGLDSYPMVETKTFKPSETSSTFECPQPSREGYKFLGWNTKKDGTGDEFTSATEVSDSEKVYAQWEPDSSYAVTIAPMDLTIYVGGNGYSGVVGADGNFTSNDFPQMGFYLTLPDEVNELIGSDRDTAVDLSNIAVLEYNDQSRSTTRSWKLELYGDEDQSHVTENGRKVFIYRVMPSRIDGGDQTVPFRTQFTDSTGKVMDDSSFVADPKNQFRNYTASIYSGKLDADLLSISFKIGDKTVSRPLNLGTGVLKIRGNNDEIYTDVSNEMPRVDSGNEDAVLAGVAQEGTEYFINNGGVRVADPSGVKLMVDQTLDDELLTAYLDKKENEDSRYSYEFNYLDLVDTNNGNAYVTMGVNQKMNVFWPVPDDAAVDSGFRVVHFRGLDRDVDTDLNEMLERYTPEKLTGTRVEIGGKQFVEFSVSSFSPFALMYEKAVTVSYKYVGEAPQSAELPPSTNVTVGEAYTAAAQKPVEGWTFDGWYVDEGCTTKFVDGSRIESNTVLYGKWTKNSPGGSSEPTEPPDPPKPSEPSGPTEPSNPSEPVDPGNTGSIPSQSQYRNPGTSDDASSRVQSSVADGDESSDSQAGRLAKTADGVTSVTETLVTLVVAALVVCMIAVRKRKCM